MKIRYIFASLVAAAALATSCEQENPLGTLEGISVDKDVIIMSEKGGTATVKITADADWTIETTALPSCLTVSPDAGKAGETTVTFTSVSNKTDVTADIKISCGGKFKFIYFTQPSDPALAYVFKTGKYWILSKSGDSWKTAKALGLEIDNSGSYGYMNVADAVGTPETNFEGTSADYAYTFEDAGNSYFYIKTPDGGYLYQDAAGKYNNFYLCSTTANAFKWKVNKLSDTEFEIKSEQGKWIQFTSYGNYGSYSSATGTLPLLVEVK